MSSDSPALASVALALTFSIPGHSPSQRQVSISLQPLSRSERVLLWLTCPQSASLSGPPDQGQKLRPPCPGLQPCVQSQGWKYCWLSTTSEQPPWSFQSRKGCTLSLPTAFLYLGLKPGVMIHQIHFTCLHRSRSCVSSKHHVAWTVRCCPEWCPRNLESAVSNFELNLVKTGWNQPPSSWACVSVALWPFDIEGWKLCPQIVLSCSVAQLCPILCDPMDCSLPGSSVHGIL